MLTLKVILFCPFEYQNIVQEKSAHFMNIFLFLKLLMSVRRAFLLKTTKLMPIQTLLKTTTRIHL